MKACSTPSAMSACGIRPIPDAICCRARARRCWSSPATFWNTRWIPRRCKPPKVHLYAERVIHGCIYQARRDVMAVCHHHAPAVMPFCIAGKPIVPVFHLGAAMRRGRAVLGPARRVRRHQSPGRQAGGGPFAGARAWPACGGADEPPRRDRRRRRIEGTGVAFDLHVPERASISCGRWPRHARRRCIRRRSELAGAISRMPNVVTRTWEYWSRAGRRRRCARARQKDRSFRAHAGAARPRSAGEGSRRHPRA